MALASSKASASATASANAGGGAKKDYEMRSLAKKHVFGVKSDTYGCLHWLDEHTLTFPVGRNVVVHNTQSNTQKFFLTSDKADAVTAIALSPNKKYIAIAESGEHPQIQVIDTSTRKRKRMLNISDLGSDRYVALEFSSDGRHLISQGGAPQWNLLYWNWDRWKPLAQVAVVRDLASVSAPAARAAANIAASAAAAAAAASSSSSSGGLAAQPLSLVTKISIDPRDNLRIVVSGAGLFRFYHYADGNLRPAGALSQAQTHNFPCHAWVTQTRIIVGTDVGDLALVENGELVCMLSAAVADGCPVHTIQSMTKGFVCGSDSGTVHIFWPTDDRDYYRRVRTIVADPRVRDVSLSDISKRGAIRSMAFSNSEETLVVATSANQIYGLPFQVDWARAGEVPAFYHITSANHAGPIVGLDMCTRKPLMATSSTDHTVRVWNLQDHSCEIVAHFASEPGALAMHPSGLHLLVCFADRVRFMNLTGDTITEAKSISIRAVSDVKFSHGGHQFALVHGNTIHIHATYSTETTYLQQLRGHSQRIRSIQWCSSSQYPTDNRIVSCSVDGAVINWATRENQGFVRESDHSDHKRMQYHAVASDDKNVWVVGTSNGTLAAGSSSADKWRVKLRELDATNLHGDVVANDFEFTDIFLTTLALAPQHRMLFGGCQDGSLKMMQLPLQGGTHDPATLAHGAPVVKLALSHDESTLVSVGQDGSIFLFEIKEDGRVVKRESVFAGEVLVSRQDLDDKHQLIQQLKQAVDDLMIDMDYQEKRRTVQHDERVKELRGAFEEQADSQSQQFASVWNAKLDQERVFAEMKKEKVEGHTSNCGKLESTKQATMKQLEDLCQERLAILERQKHDFDLQLRLRDEAIARHHEESDLRFKERLQGEQDTILKLTAQVQRNEETFAETRRQLELDTDTEISNVRRKYDEQLQKERDRYLHLKGDFAVQKKSCTSLTKEIENRGAEVRALDNTRAALHTQVKELQARVTQLLAEIQEREEQIAEREKKMYRLKRQNQELEKHKFVLDHRIRQLKLQIEPRQKAIKQEKDNIAHCDEQLEALHRSHLSLRGNIEELKEDIVDEQERIKRLMFRLKDFATYKSRVERDIGNLSQQLQNPRALRTDVDSLFQEHVTKRKGSKAPPLEEHLQVEFEAQTQFLARTVESLSHKVHDDLAAHRAEQATVMGENVQLIREIDDLRKEVKLLKLNAHAEGGGAGGAGSGMAEAASANGDGTVASTLLASSARNSKKFGSAAGSAQSGSPTSAAVQAQALHHEAEHNTSEIRKLKLQIEELEHDLSRIGVAAPPPRVLQPMTS